MAEAYTYRDLGAGAFTGTTPHTLVGGTLPTVPATALSEADSPGVELDGLVVASYLNDTGGARNIDLDLLVGSSTLLVRAPLYTLAANASTRVIRAHYTITWLSATSALVTVEANASATGASGSSGDDARNVTRAAIVTLDSGTDITFNVQATLATVSNLSTHAIDASLVRLNKVITANVVSGGGGGGGGGTGDVSEIAGTRIMRAIDWNGSSYPARPGGSDGFQSFTYVGPVPPNGANSPGGPQAVDGYDDTSGA